MKGSTKSLLIILCLIPAVLAGGVAAADAQVFSTKNIIAKNRFANKVLSKPTFAERLKSPFLIVNLDDKSELSADKSESLFSSQNPCETALMIAFEQTVNGQLSSSDCRLDDGSYADFYIFNGNQGQQVTISLNSTAFDTYLGLANEDATFIREDDDGGGGTNSRIVATLPNTGLYVILANSVFPNQFGNYSLSLAGSKVCTYSLEPTGAEVPAAGGDFTFTVNTQPGCYWSASTPDSFITASSMGDGTGTVKYNVMPNGGEPRTGTIRVGGQIFTISQPVLVCSYSINPTSVTVPATETEGTFTITAPDGCPWTANSSDYFIWSDNFGRGTSEIRYTVSTNNGADRTGKITVNGLDFTITQPGLNCTFSVSPTKITVDRFEHYGTISVNTQPGCFWSTTGGFSWVMLANHAGTGSGTISYRIFPYLSFGERTHIIGFYGLGLIRIEFTQTGIPFRTNFDFDGDGRTDFSFFRPSNGGWYLQRSNLGFTAVQFGLPEDLITPADFDGDRLTDVAVFRPGSGVWYLQQSQGGFTAVPFGQEGDIPVPADFDGDGKADIAIFRPSTATWYILKSGGGVSIQQFGVSSDIPVVGDYDGDKKADLAIFRPSAGEWWYLRSSDGDSRAFQFGSSADKLVQADYTGDGKTDIAFFRPSTREWFVLRSEDFSYYSAPFGLNEDIPVPGDYDGDGKADFAVWRESNKNWYILRSGLGVLIEQFGSAGDKPVPSAFIP